jgi:hypothetical protein
LLPQTTSQPSDESALDASLGVLWNAMVTGASTEALRVFFPQSAYIRMKTGVIPDPSADYVDRLVAFYRLDIAAYHDRLGPRPADARLVGTSFDAGYATWIPPGDCENLIGYWHLPGVRLVYSEDVADLVALGLVRRSPRAQPSAIQRGHCRCPGGRKRDSRASRRMLRSGWLRSRRGPRDPSCWSHTGRRRPEVLD